MSSNLSENYISFPIERSPDDLLEAAYNFIKDRIPGWEENDGNLDTWLLQINATQAADLLAIATDIPDSIFRYFGRVMIGFPDILATQAQAPSTWTMQDNSGYTIPAGTQVGVLNTIGELIPFTVAVAVIVPAGSSVTAAGEVTLVAIEAGASGSGLGSPGYDLELIDPLDYVSLVELTAATTGGVDSESLDEYRNRLVRRLRRLSTRPILPRDFSDMALEVAGVERAVAIDGYNPLANEIQTVDVDATSGTFTLTFTGQTTAAIAWNATAAAVQAALEVLSNIAPGDVVVSGGPGPALWTIEFRGAYDGVNVAQMTSNAAGLSGGAASVTHATTRAGIGVSSFNNERMVAIAGIDDSGANISSGKKSEVDTLLQANREVNFIVNVMDPSRTTIAVDFTFKIITGYNAASVEAAAEAAVTDYLSPSKWGRDPRYTDTGGDQTWIETSTLYYNELIQLISNVEGVDRVVTLTYAKNSDALASPASIALLAPAALTVPGVINGAAV